MNFCYARVRSNKNKDIDRYYHIFFNIQHLQFHLLVFMSRAPFHTHSYLRLHIFEYWHFSIIFVETWNCCKLEKQFSFIDWYILPYKVQSFHCCVNKATYPDVMCACAVSCRLTLLHLRRQTTERVLLCCQRGH